jgi:hypothetical protein
VEVELVDREHWLMSCDEAALAAGANLAVIGSELVQFQSATPLRAGCFELDGVRRCSRRVPEEAAVGHCEGETFVLLEPGTLQPLKLPGLSKGGHVSVSVGGVAVTAPWPGQARGSTGQYIADPRGGVTVDTEARAALSAILATLRAKGLVQT